MSTGTYVVISPVRNEQQYLPLTIQSMIAQTVRPVCWVIVNDGSTDSTGRLASRAAEQHSWIKVAHRKDRGFREAGGGVMEAFYEGYRLIEDDAWQYLVKLDGDLSFEPCYFAECFSQFGASPKLGIAGGTIGNAVNGAWQVESKVDPAFHVRGATKIYRRECWRDLGGLIRAPGWDTLDEIKANMLGWDTRTFPDVRLTHHRQAGDAYGKWSNWVKNGRANYVVGYHPIFMAVKCLRRVFERPYLIAACGLWIGFVGGYLKRIPQADEKEAIIFFRRQQMNRLLGRRSLWSN